MKRAKPKNKKLKRWNTARKPDPKSYSDEERKEQIKRFLRDSKGFKVWKQ